MIHEESVARDDEVHDRTRPRYLIALSVGALGVVYGDIGTSPLYALREAFLASDDLVVNNESVLGILSLLLWSLTLIVSIKYLIFVLRADNEGEGGILALLALVVGSGKRGRGVLIGMGLFGTALLYGDGMITPAISVLSAVEGLEIAAPQVEPYVVLIASVILIALFSIQHRGTGAIGAVFGPVMILWFSALAILGVYHLSREPGVLASVNPAWAARFVSSHPLVSFLALGAIFLVVTGSEALYADMGHFGKRPIRYGWTFVVMPALILNYLGQGALIMRDPSAIENPFFLMPPGWALIPMVVLATMATVIASQALISGAYSLTMQAIQLGYLPRQHIEHTSTREIGQIYVPMVNWFLMVAAVGLVIAFGSSGSLAAAYGVAVTTTMIITTALLAVVMRERWHWRLSLIVPVITLFAVVDLAFMGANLLKVPAGGWFPLVVAGVVFTAMFAWKRGRSIMRHKLRQGELSIERFIGSIVENPQIRVPGTAVYLYSIVGAAPPTLLANLLHNEVLHETVIIVSVVTEDRPRVPPAGRAIVHDLGEGFFQVVLRFGFMDKPDVPHALSAITLARFGFDDEDATYFLGRETVLPSGRSRFAHGLDSLFGLMMRNATGAASHFELPPDRVVEIGSHVEL